MKICIIGTGYVGLVTGASLAFLGNQVTCVDIDPHKVEKLNQGRSPIFEPGLEELMRTGMEKGNLSFMTQLSEGARDAEILFIAVGTPPSPDGTPDLSFVRDVARGIAGCIYSERETGGFKIIINKSTVPVGCGNWVEMIVREEIRRLLAQSLKSRDVANDGGTRGDPYQQIAKSFTVVSNPEFLREGSAIGDTFFPDRIVVGANDARALQTLRKLYEPLVNQDFIPPASIQPRPETMMSVPLVETDLTSAEMIKYAANSFLAMKISFANEIANICERTGADIKRVTEGIGLDDRIGARFLNAGIGWGGSCFGKDISALIEITREYNYQPELLIASQSVNTKQRQVVIQKLQASLRILKGKTIGLLGLAFKPDTDDVRDAPSFYLVSELLKMGARVKVYDPVAMAAFEQLHPDLDIHYATGSIEMAGECDALVVVTEWEEFSRLDLKQIRAVMKGNIMIDGRNIFDPKTASDSGLNYLSIGRDFAVADRSLANAASHKD